MNIDNAISSCHLLEWVEMGWVCLGGSMGEVWDTGGEEKGEGVAGTEGKAGCVGS
jgi:hypothetical protein